MKRSEERRYNNYDYPRCEGFKSPITIRDDQENKGKLASATSNQATTETHDPITSNNNEQRQPFAPRHKVNTEIQFENHEDGQESHIRVHTPRRNKHEQYGHRRSYTPRDYADSEPNRFYNENGNLYHRRIHKHRPNKHEQHGQGRFYTPRDNVDTEHPMSNLEDGYHGTPRPNKHDQYRHRRSYTSKDDVERECSSSEGNHHDYRRARYKDQYGYRQCYVQRDAESEEQATKHCPRTTDLHECYNEKRTDKCGKEKSPSTPLEKVKAQDQAPVSPISKERLIDHQGKCKLAMEEVSPAAKAINSFTNEFIKKLKEISTLNWSSFNIGSYYDKTKNCHPDEFDIMIYPNLSVEVNFDVIKIPGFYKVKLVSPRVQELEHVLDNDRYIIPGKFKNYAFEMFDRVLGTDGIRQGRRTKKMPKPGGCSPAYTVFYDAFPGKKSIDIDLVPCFNIDGWPPDKIARKINPSWIAIDDVVNRAMKYYDVVCKTCPEDATDKNLLFRLSFSRTEKMLIKHANSADKLNLKKNAFRFIKLCIQDLKDKHPGEIKKFCSYHIKQFMLTQYDTWPTREREGVRIQRYLIGELIKTLSLANPTIANYFITNDNVIRYVPSEEIAVIVKGLQEKDKLLH
ncbi:cyclic GMP-AMP synthase-like receptor isoform X9 [Mytilus galloprovincialis]|uniref:cyclic GMP-AMP synthase-like receptor isoform X9 n=1 Tax=Mytilus galloprovincialis TaxID=29158 RepID=UPI003F7C2C6A